jgi:putative SOS response-associated peptidase YedK
MFRLLLLAMLAIWSGCVLCGRFNLTKPQDIEARFGFLDWHEKRIEPRFNIAPSQEILTIVRDPGPEVRAARWGFAPFWAEGTDSKRPPPINARVETLARSPMFREALVHTRCLIPATGFYEWQAQPGTGLKIPMHIRLKSGAVFAFAGLWAPGKHHGTPTATIVTCGPNELTAAIHNRMPVILRQEDEAVWLDPTVVDPEQLLALLRPYPPEEMEAYAVSSLVNSFQNDGPELIEHMPTVIQQPSLF